MKTTLEIAQEHAKDDGFIASSGDAIRSVRMALSLSLREAAVIIGVTAVELGEWERNKKHVTLEVLGMACRRMAALADERDNRTLERKTWPAKSVLDRVLVEMRKRLAESQQRLFWLGQFESAGEPDAVRKAVDALDREGIVEWRLSLHCNGCEREWGGHPSKVPRRCPFCGYDHEGEEGPELFIPSKFALAAGVTP